MKNTKKRKVVLLLVSLGISAWLTMQIFTQSANVYRQNAATLFVATEDISAGDIISESSLRQVTFHGAGLEGLVSTKPELINSIALIDIPAKAPISANMVESAGFRSREDRIYTTQLTNEGAFSVGDRVDVVFLGKQNIPGQDGEIAVSDARVKSVSPKISLIVDISAAISLARMERDGMIVLLRRP